MPVVAVFVVDRPVADVSAGPSVVGAAVVPAAVVPVVAASVVDQPAADASADPFVVAAFAVVPAAVALVVAFAVDPPVAGAFADPFVADVAVDLFAVAFVLVFDHAGAFPAAPGSFCRRKFLFVGAVVAVVAVFRKIYCPSRPADP